MSKNARSCGDCSRPETWHSIPGWEGLYEVSNHGRIRGLHKNGGARKAPRILQPKLTEYRVRLTVLLCRPGHKRRYCYVHHAVLRTFVGPCPRGLEACHRDDNPLHNCVANLRWDTHASNMRDAIANGRRPRGAAHASAKLTDAKVRMIRRLRQRGHGVRAIARRLNLNSGTVSRAATGRTWRHV